MDRYGNNQVKQPGVELSPADGGSETPGVGLKVVSGKKGYVTDKPIWSQETGGDDGGDAIPPMEPAGSDSTDEKALYKKVDNSEGLPQTFRTAKGAGDAGPSDQVSVDTETRDDTQSVADGTDGEHEVDMPQTSFTHEDGGGAPAFKH